MMVGYSRGFVGKKLLISGLLMVGWVSLFSQLSEPGIPESFLIKTKAAMIIPEKTLDSVQIQKLKAEDAMYSIPNRYGVVQQVDIDIKEAGVKSTIAGKGTIWQYKIVSPNALSLAVHFKRFNLPDGAKVFIYNLDHNQLLGAFTKIDNSESKVLSIADFKGSHAILEYFEPFNASFSGELLVGAISQAYMDIQSVLVSRIGINCPSGANWQDEKHAVCLMTFVSGSSSYYCTGFLVNNVRLDGTPYFQTANHCISNSSEASTLVTYFNYENSSCSSTDANRYTQTLSGASLKANNSYSDFSLLLLNQIPPNTYNPYYAGWNASGLSPTAGTCVHHPSGTAKCISLQYTTAPYSYSGTINWDNNYTSSPNTHWKVVFDIGNTEAGSSGSPLFDENKRVIGQLHGGDDFKSFYGKFSLSWNYGTSANQQLKAWLDPDNTGALVLDGTYLRIKPKSAFTTQLTNVCVGAVVNFTDQTKYQPKQWKWQISPASFTYSDGTDSTWPSPHVIFKNEGTYSVELTTSNIYGVDSVVKTDYIIAKNNIKVALNNVPVDSVLCGNIVSQYPIKASGALQYTFSLQNAGNLSYSIKSDSIYLTLKPDMEKSGSFDTWLKVDGTFGSCKSSDSAKLKITMQTNNDISNAIQLWPGRNPVYSNLCATTQSNEPHAPYSQCYANNGWCSALTSTLKNTVWFTFVGPSSGRVTISTQGLSNKIAVYSAELYSDIISGNNRYYSVIGANEGRSSTNPASLIENLSVEPGKVYWLQVDGSKGAVGNFSIDLICNSLDVYPNPSNGLFNVTISNVNDGLAEIELYSLTGKLLFKRQVEVSGDNNRFAFDASAYPPGMYLLKTAVNGTVLKTKVMIAR